MNPHENLTPSDWDLIFRYAHDLSKAFPVLSEAQLIIVATMLVRDFHSDDVRVEAEA
jgi:hypothetical protein